MAEMGEMGKLGPREGARLLQGHTAKDRQNLNTGLLLRLPGTMLSSWHSTHLQCSYKIPSTRFSLP